MEKIAGEEELKGLEEEIDSAVDRLFTEKNRKGSFEFSPDRAFLSTPRPEEKKEDRWSDDLTLGAMGMAPPLSVDTPLADAMPPAPEPPRVSDDSAEPPPVGLPSFMRGLERLETHLLALEWEITRENLDRTQQEVLALLQTFRENPEVAAVLTLMDRSLSAMTHHEGDIHPGLVKFLLDAKETVKLLLSEEESDLIRTARQLACEGIDARFACLQDLGRQGTPLMGGPEAPAVREHEPVPGDGSKHVEETLGRLDELASQGNQTLERIEGLLSHLSSLSTVVPRDKMGRAAEPVHVMLFRAGDRLFGLESERILKLYKVPDPFSRRFTHGTRVKMKDLEVRVVDLRKLFFLGDSPASGDVKVLLVKSGGEYAGLLIDQMVDTVSAQPEARVGQGDYVTAIVHWTWGGQPVEVPLLAPNRI
jgi:hypothetical protein